MIVLGSRGSDLALWQARHVQALLQDHASLASEIRIIRTAGDRISDVSLASLPGKGFFTREIEAALLGGEIDLAVHSHKDLPTESPPGLTIAAVPERGEVAECLLVRPEAWIDAHDLPLRDAAVVGTGSARRRDQLLALRPDLEIRDLRGNVPTRVRKAVAGEYDAVVLAKAGLVRLGLDTRPLLVHEFPPMVFVPAPAQGALALQTRLENEADPREQQLHQALARLHHAPSALCVRAERLLLAALEGGCNLPLGAYATLQDSGIRLLAVLGDGSGNLRRCDVQGATPEAAAQRAQASLNPG
jgi:hydroxymethylbilane synthase